jgi:predicted TIM-barrel fold metal-dependent hydrolase
MLQALVDEGMVLCLHIGGAWDIVKLAPEAPVDHMIVIPSQITMLTAQDLLFGPTLRRFPTLRVALSEGGIGWIPFYLERVDRHFQNQSWIDNTFGQGKLPSDVFREHFLACYITDPAGLKLREDIGIDVIAWECDYPHTDTTWPLSPEYAWKEFESAGCSADEVDKITWQNACRFFDWDPFSHTSRERANVGSLRARASDVDTSVMSRQEWRTRNEAAGIGLR